MGARDSTVKLALRRTLAFAAIVLLVFALVEGASSAVIFSYDVLFSRTRVAERRHTQYDSLLGWVNIPSFYIADMYGRGRYLRTNSRGFRSDRETEVAVPEGKYRIICSGDSFTLGYGVANDRTWCHILTELDERFETVNMGQGGYGVDQAYLWYMRDGKVLEHTIHLFAFITADFERMASPSFIGYGKPVLRLEEAS